MTGGTVEKKVVLRYEVADAGASNELRKIGEEAKKATSAYDGLKASIKNTPTGGGGSGFGLYGASPAMANGFPSMAGGLHTPNAGGINMAALAGASYRDPAAAFVAMKQSGGGAVASGSMDMMALARAGFTPSAGMNMAALAGANYDPLLGRNGAYVPPSLQQARFSPTSDPMLQTMNQHRTDPGTLAALGGGAYRMGAAALRYGVPAIAAVKTASAVASAVHDSDLVAHQGGTGGEQMRALANGTWLTRQGLGIVDEFRGRAQGLARVEYDNSIQQKVREGAEEQRLFRNDVRLQRMELEARAATLNRDGRMARISPTDRSTVTGERDYGRQLAMQPLNQSVLDSQRNLSTAVDVQDRQMRMRDELDKRRSKLEIERGALQTKAGESGGSERLMLLLQGAAKNQEFESAKRELEALDKRIEKSKQEIIGLRAEVGQARIGVLQGRIGILEQREGVAAGQANRIGRMSELDYRMNRQAAEQVQRYGLGVLPPEWEARAEAYAPQAVGKLYEERGIRRNRDAVGGPFAEFEDRLPDVRGKIDKERNELVDAIRDLKKDTANQAANELIGKEFVAVLNGAIAKQVGIEIAKLKNEIERGNNNK